MVYIKIIGVSASTIAPSNAYITTHTTHSNQPLNPLNLLKIPISKSRKSVLAVNLCLLFMSNRIEFKRSKNFRIEIFWLRKKNLTANFIGNILFKHCKY